MKKLNQVVALASVLLAIFLLTGCALFTSSDKFHMDGKGSDDVLEVKAKAYMEDASNPWLSRVEFEIQNKSDKDVSISIEKSTINLDGKEPEKMVDSKDKKSDPQVDYQVMAGKKEKKTLDFTPGILGRRLRECRIGADNSYTLVYAIDGAEKTLVVKFGNNVNNF